MSVGTCQGRQLRRGNPTGTYRRMWPYNLTKVYALISVNVIRVRLGALTCKEMTLNRSPSRQPSFSAKARTIAAACRISSAESGSSGWPAGRGRISPRPCQRGGPRANGPRSQQSTKRMHVACYHIGGLTCHLAAALALFLVPRWSSSSSCDDGARRRSKPGKEAG